METKFTNPQLLPQSAVVAINAATSALNRGRLEAPNDRIACCRDSVPMILAAPSESEAAQRHTSKNDAEEPRRTSVLKLT